MTAISPKIEPRHLRLLAAVYVRQSTPQQLQNNQESTRRQYELAGRACRMAMCGCPLGRKKNLDAGCCA